MSKNDNNNNTWTLRISWHKETDEHDKKSFKKRSEQSWPWCKWKKTKNTKTDANDKCEENDDNNVKSGMDENERMMQTINLDAKLLTWWI